MLMLQDILSSPAVWSAIYRASMEEWARDLVMIADKAGQIVPLELLPAQRELHRRLERQRESRGLVRAIVLKARRLGISTYVCARYYHRTTMTPNRKAFILTHEDKATQELFGLVKTMHEAMPDQYRPAVGAANAKELVFDRIASGYRVGTAKNTAGLGRGMTIQLFHGSEVAFWPPTANHLAGVLQTVSLVEGTEIILESTANGLGGHFYDQWVLAERGQSDFIPIFLPWHSDPANRRALSTDYEPSPEEEDYQRIHSLDDEQLCWAHFKNIDLGGEPGKLCALWRQEYPATAAEAFQATGSESLIPAEAILRARRTEAQDQRHMPRVLGVDVARGGGDKTRIVDRQGRKAGKIDVGMDTDDLVQIAHRVMTILRDNPDIRKAFIDVTGVGAGVYDICRNNGFEARVSAVNYGSSASDPNRYINRRGEIWGRLKEWLLDPGGADIPDNDEWHRHIAAPGFKYDVSSRMVLEPKDQIKKRLGFSPDVGDALAQTFAEILSVEVPDMLPKWMHDHIDSDGPGDFMTA